jgi:hypothetical protein
MAIFARFRLHFNPSGVTNLIIKSDLGEYFWFGGWERVHWDEGY